MNHQSPLQFKGEGGGIFQNDETISSDTSMG